MSDHGSENGDEKGEYQYNEDGDDVDLSGISNDVEGNPIEDDDCQDIPHEEVAPPVRWQDTVDVQLRELELFAFASEPDPKEDPTGRLAYKNKCAEYGIMFPVNSIIDKFDTDDLVLDHCGLGDKGAMALAETLRINQRITSLSLVGNNIGPKGGEYLLTAIRDSKTIRTLNLSQNRLGYRAAHLGAATIGSLMKLLLLRNDKITEIILRENRISDSDMTDIADGLIENSTLQSIDLSYNELGPRGGDAVGHVLRRNSELKSIDIGWNLLRHQGTMSVIKDGLAETNVLRSICLAWNGISDEGGVLLGQVIRDNSSLESIDVSHNRIGPNGAASLAMGIKTNVTLKILILSDNPLRDTGAASIVRAIRDNNSLQTVVLRSTDAGTMAARELEETMKVKPNVDIQKPGTCYIPPM